MLVTVKYFGLITEITQTEEEQIEIKNMNVVFDLNVYLLKKYPKLKEVTFNIAQNQSIVTFKSKLNNGDIIALLPPFAGG